MAFTTFLALAALVLALPPYIQRARAVWNDAVEQYRADMAEYRANVAAATARADRVERRIREADAIHERAVRQAMMDLLEASRPRDRNAQAAGSANAEVLGNDPRDGATITGYVVKF